MTSKPERRKEKDGDPEGQPPPKQGTPAPLSKMDAAAARPQEPLPTQTAIRAAGGIELTSEHIARIQELLTSEPPLPARIGPYEIKNRLASGGMGSVYLAARVDDYKQLVAIKLIKRGMDTDEILRRFRHERQVLAALKHPHIAQLLDGGTTEDGLPYFVMEYIEGAPIDTYCNQQQLNTRERLLLFREVCAAVQFAHQNTVIHRDLKPDNILVTAAGVPKLVDFGLAKLTNRELGFQTIDPTAPEYRLMTPEYASPEQVRGGPISTASDIYSLGVVLYELLTGHRPYELPSRSLPEIERAICETEPERPSSVIRRHREVRQRDGGTSTLTPEVVSRPRDGHPSVLRRRLAGDIDNIVLKALRKEPPLRYSSAEQFAADIARHLENEPVLAAAPSAAYRLRKFVRRNKIGVIAGALVGLSLLGGIIGTAAGMFRAQREQRRAEMEEGEKSRLLVEANVQTARLATQRGDWRTALTNYDRALAAGYPDEIRLRLGRVEAWLALGESAKALAELEGLEKRKDLGEQKGALLLWLADTALMQSLLSSEANELIHEALEAGLRPDDEAYARAMTAERAPDAAALFQKALDLNPFHHRSRDFLVKTLILLGRLDEARTHLEYARQYFPEDPMIRGILAVTQALQGDLKRAQAMIGEIQPKLGEELTEMLQAVLRVIDQINQSLNEDDPEVAEVRMKAAFQELIMLPLAYYQKVSVVRADPQDLSQIAGLGARLPPFLAKGLGRFISALIRTALLHTPLDMEEMKAGLEAHPEGYLYLLYGTVLYHQDRLPEAEAALRTAAQTPSFYDCRRMALFRAAVTEWILADVGGRDPKPEMRVRAAESTRALIYGGNLGPHQAGMLLPYVVKAGELDLARTILAGWERHTPGDLAALEWRAQVELEAGAYGPALDAANAVLVRQPDRPDALRYREETLRRMKAASSPEPP